MPYYDEDGNLIPGRPKVKNKWAWVVTEEGVMPVEVRKHQGVYKTFSYNPETQAATFYKEVKTPIYDSLEEANKNAPIFEGFKEDYVGLKDSVPRYYESKYGYELSPDNRLYVVEFRYNAASGNRKAGYRRYKYYEDGSTTTGKLATVELFDSPEAAIDNYKSLDIPTNVVDDVKKIGSLNYKDMWHNTPTVNLIKTIEENNLEIYVKNKNGELVRLGLDETAQIGENAIQGSPMFDDGKIAIAGVIEKVEDGYALDLYGKNPDDLAKLQEALPSSLDPLRKPEGTPYELIPIDTLTNVVDDFYVVPPDKLQEAVNLVKNDPRYALDINAMHKDYLEMLQNAIVETGFIGDTDTRGGLYADLDTVLEDWLSEGGDLEGNKFFNNSPTWDNLPDTQNVRGLIASAGGPENIKEGYVIPQYFKDKPNVLYTDTPTNVVDDTPTNILDEDMTWLYKNQSIADLQDFLKDKYGNVLYEYGISTMEARSGLLLEELSDGSLYVDTINIRPGSQGQGKGQEILSIIKDWAEVNKTLVYIKPAALPDNLTYKGQPVSSEQQLDNLFEFYKKQGWKENPNFTILSPDEKAAQMSLSANYDFGTKPTELYSPLVYTPEGVNVSELPQNPYIDDITSFTDKFNREGKIFLDGYNQPIVNEVITETLKIEVWYGTSGFIDENDWNQSKFSEVAKDLEAKGLHPNDIVNDLSKYIPPDKIPTPAEIFRGGVRNEYFTDAIVTMLSEGSGNFYIEDVAGDDLFPENKPRRNLGLYYAISGETPEETNARLAEYKNKHGDVFQPQGPDELRWVQYAAEGERVIDTPTNVGDDVVEGTVTRMEEYRFNKLLKEVEDATPPVHKITTEQARTIDDAIEETMALMSREKFELIQGSKDRPFKNVDITYDQAFKVIKNKLINIFADGLTLVDAYELGLIIMSITGAVDTSVEGIIDIVFPNDTKDNRSFPEKVIANLDDLAPYSPTEQALRKNKESRAMKLNPEVVETARDSYNRGDITFFEHMTALDKVIKGQKSYVYEELTPNIGMVPTKIDHANPQKVFYNIGETIRGNK